MCTAAGLEIALVTPTVRHQVRAAILGGHDPSPPIAGPQQHESDLVVPDII
jgi:hypothetical protein